jgi:uncharacterized cysteine cluster protein YcgN (CxxCxxCC family)
MTQAFDHEALYSKSKVYIERSLKAEHEADQAIFQLWASLSLELLGKAALARIHPSLVADPDDPDSLFAACGHPFSPKRRSITAKTVFERLGHICKHYLKEEKDFCMELANRRNAELHSGELPYTELRAITWVPKMWKVCKMLLEAQGKTLDDWLGSAIAAEVEDEIKKAPTVQVVEGKLKSAKGKFEKMYQTAGAKEAVRTTTRFALATFLPLLRKIDADSYDAAQCPACRCEGGVGGEKWHEEVTNGEITEEPWLECVDSLYVTSAFRCVVCGLQLDGRDELEVAGVLDQFTKTEVREPDYGPDYGND